MIVKLVLQVHIALLDLRPHVQLAIIVQLIQITNTCFHHNRAKRQILPTLLHYLLLVTLNSVLVKLLQVLHLIVLVDFITTFLALHKACSHLLTALQILLGNIL